MPTILLVYSQGLIGSFIGLTQRRTSSPRASQVTVRKHLRPVPVTAVSYRPWESRCLLMPRSHLTLCTQPTENPAMKKVIWGGVFIRIKAKTNWTCWQGERGSCSHFLFLTRISQGFSSSSLTAMWDCAVRCTSVLRLSTSSTQHTHLQTFLHTDKRPSKIYM